jgi:hypothetical protein
MKGYTGAHFLGGRFVPKYAVFCIVDKVAEADLILLILISRSVEQKYELNLPRFSGSQQFARL